MEGVPKLDSLKNLSPVQVYSIASRIYIIILIGYYSNSTTFM